MIRNRRRFPCGGVCVFFLRWIGEVMVRAS